MTKKIIISLSVIGLVAAIVIGGTWAYFSDTETSASNTFSSGTMDFRIARPGATGHAVFDVSNLRPGQIVEGYLAVVNDSTEGMDMKWKAGIPSFSNGILDDVLEVRITGRPTAGYDQVYTDFTNVGYTIAGPPDAPVTHWSNGDPRWIPIADLKTNNTILAWNYNCCEEGASGCTDQPFRVKWVGIYKIEVRMLETAGDGYQGKSFTADIDFYATQCEASLF